MGDVLSTDKYKPWGRTQAEGHTAVGRVDGCEPAAWPPWKPGEAHDTCAGVLAGQQQP